MQNRSIFDWVVFSIFHVFLIGGISIAGFAVYGPRLGAWVATSAIIAGAASMYVFAKEPAGATLMKVWLGLAVAVNAAYIVHNGARQLGIEAFNSAQLKRYEIGMAEAAKARSRRVAGQLGLSAKYASELEKVFDSGVSIIAALLAFLELASAIVIFSIASKHNGYSRETETGNRSRTINPLPTTSAARAEADEGKESRREQRGRLGGRDLKGESLLQSADSDQPSAISEKRVEAEACFQKTIEVARRQQARFWELRATMSLARLWRRQGKTSEARQALAEIYGWFTEGFDMPDLKDAEALLAELRKY